MGNVIDQLQLGARVQYSSRLNTADRAMHQYMAGKIQAAIAELPAHLQLLGHWLYAPEGIAPEGAENALWTMVAVLSGIDDEESHEWYLARCALHRYKELALGRPEEQAKLRTPQQIKNWVLDWYDVEINSRRWGRLYRIYWERVLSEVSKLDARALEVVGEQVYSEKNQVRLRAKSYA